MARNRRPDPLGATSLGEAAAIGRIEKALFGGGDRLVNVGRYEIRELIGSGAFGKVYRARDPQLDRDVALKVLTAESGALDDTDRAELLGEARVMASLGHPNVAAVHDAGVLDDERGRVRVFIAMELVNGTNLRDWLTQPRTVAAILDVMRQVGRGLAAAHVAGIVHRDLKPENILVGTDGRARVVDFGLARGHAQLSDEAGAIVGTPAYMAPEQLAGERATPLTDQFAYCVTLWEALYAERPFAGQSIDELRRAMATGPAPPGRTAPARVVRALLRGLAVAPSKRFESLAELLNALEPHRARWIVPLALATTAAAGLAIGVVATRSPAATPTDPCPAPTADLVGIRDPPRKLAIQAAFAVTRSPIHGDTFTRIATALDRRTGAWLDGHRDACRATSVRHEQSPDLLDRRMSCLRDWRRQLRSVTDAFTTATPAVVQGAVIAVANLPAIDRCADLDALAAGPGMSVDPAQRTRIEQLFEQLASARGLLLTGKPGATKAMTVIDELARDPLATQHAPLAVALAQWRADAATALGHHDDARTAARAAFDRAVGAGDRRAAATAATSIAFLGAYDTRRKAESLQWVTTGRSIVDKLDHALDLDARLATVEGNVQMVNADAAAATAPLERAVAAWRTLDPDHPSLPVSLAMLGVADLGVGNLDAADTHLRDALARAETALGPSHPDVASIHMKLALALAARGHYVDADRSTARAIEILHAIFGTDHTTLLYAHGAGAQHAQMRGDLAGAERSYTEAARIATANAGPDSAMVAQISLGLADVLARAGRGREAVMLARRARESVAKTADERDLGLAYADAILARALAVTGQRDDAIARARAAVARCHAAPAGLPSGPCAIIHQALGDLSRDPSEIDRELEAAARAITTGASDPVRLAEIRFALARARLLRDRTAALELGRLAERELPRDGDPPLRAAIAAGSHDLSDLATLDVRGYVTITCNLRPGCGNSPGKETHVEDHRTRFRVRCVHRRL